MVGTADPLRDQSYEFVHRVATLGVNARLAEIRKFPHGFLNYYDLPVVGMKEAKFGINLGIRWIKEMLSI